MSEKKQAVRSSFDLKTLLKEETNNRKKLAIKVQELEQYVQHLEDSCCELEKKNDQSFMKMQRAEKNYDAIAKLNKQHEFKVQILDKENQRLKQLIDHKNQQIEQDEKRLDILSSSAKTFSNDLFTSKNTIRELEDKIALMAHEHNLALNKAQAIVDEYFKYKFLDLHLTDPEKSIADINKIKNNTKINIVKPKTRVKAVIDNNISSPKQIIVGEHELDNDFHKQLNFLETLKN